MSDEVIDRFGKLTVAYRERIDKLFVDRSMTLWAMGIKGNRFGNTGAIRTFARYIETLYATYEYYADVFDDGDRIGAGVGVYENAGKEFHAGACLSLLYLVKERLGGILEYTNNDVVGNMHRITTETIQSMELILKE